MEKSKNAREIITSLEELEHTLSDLHSALGELSLSISDWHFATDVEKRKQVEYMTQECLTKIATIGQDKEHRMLTMNAKIM